MTRIIVVVLCSAANPSPVLAQDRPSVGLAAGYAEPLHGDIGYGAVLLIGSVRIPRGPVIALEPELTVWRGSEEQRLGAPVPGGPETTVRDVRRSWSVGANVLAVAPGGALRPFGGGGVGMYWERTSQRVRGGQAFVTEHTNGPRLGLQAIAGVDIPITRRWKVFGAFRVEMRSLEDVGGGLGLQGAGGARFEFR